MSLREPLQHVGAEGRGGGDRDPRASPRAEDRLRPERRERLASRFVARAIDDQDAVEVVELVLDDAGRGRDELEVDGLALDVRRLRW